MGDALRVWDGNAVKLGCDDCCIPNKCNKIHEVKKNKIKHAKSKINK